MSLAQHLTPDDGFEQSERDDGSSVCPTETTASWRRMSYDAFASVETQVVPEPYQPNKASTLRRICQVGLATLFCILASGLVFGFASIKPILISDGVYHDLCPHTFSNSRMHGRNADSGHYTEKACTKQDMRLNLVFIVSSVTTNASSLITGFCLDRLGRRFCVTVSAFLLLAGTALLASRSPADHVDGYMLGFFLVSLGGTFLFLPSYHLSNAFPRHSGIIVALITCAFDASSAVLFLYSLVWSATDGRATLSKFFLLYLSVPAAIMIAEWTIMPKHRYQSLLEMQNSKSKTQASIKDVHSSDEDISDRKSLSRVESDTTVFSRTKTESTKRISSDGEERQESVEQLSMKQDHYNDGISGVLHGKSVRHQMRTLWFWLLLLLTAFQMLRMNYFIATIRSQYQYMLGSDKEAAKVTDFYNVALPVGGVAATPFIAIALNNLNTVSVIILLAIWIAALSVLNCLAYTWAGFATVVVFVTYRPLYFSAMSYTASKVFGFATFGRVWGTVTCASGLLNLVQPTFDHLLAGPLHGDPLPVNIFLGVVGTVLAIVFAAYAKVQDVKGRRSVRLQS